MAAERSGGQAGWRLIVLTGIVSAVLSPGVCAEVVKVKAPEGGEVSLNVTYRGEPSEINWKVDGHKVVDMELSPALSIVRYRLKDRANISESNGSLTIRNLQVGDSGRYKAEVLVDNLIQETYVTLTVIECPPKPTIYNNSTKHKIVLTCESKTSGVKYEWWNQTDMVAQGASYTSPRPREDVTLTCVVYVDKDVCMNNSSVTIPAILVSGRSHWPMFVLLLLFLLAICIALLYFNRKGVSQTFTPQKERGMPPGSQCVSETASASSAVHPGKEPATEVEPFLGNEPGTEVEPLPGNEPGTEVEPLPDKLPLEDISHCGNEPVTEVEPFLGHADEEPVGKSTIPPTTKEVEVTSKEDGQILDIEDGSVQRNPNGDRTVDDMTSADEDEYMDTIRHSPLNSETKTTSQDGSEESVL